MTQTRDESRARATPPTWLMGVVVVAALISLAAAVAAAWLYFTTDVSAAAEPPAPAAAPAEPIRLDPQRAKVAATAARAQAVLARVEAHRAKTGAYPDLASDEAGYAPLDVFLGEAAPLATDAWGHALRFAVAGRAVVSAGADGRFGTEDDISATLAGAAKEEGRNAP
ncbi:MAG TPA: hypothetical protein IAC79_00030 [Candidatus Spyradenecus faecavium]|uniref:Type II secretion system protein GspG C-terminal domain-containing protein n=1 Tax=Candidatus Spyradenecus faecavium TaxID=2840947 RepID=A0A9D1T2B0_9BACT|nr:hypothetical protein [Candidatus Spyradenecus faecavium]